MSGGAKQGGPEERRRAGAPDRHDEGGSKPRDDEPGVADGHGDRDSDPAGQDPREAWDSGDYASPWEREEAALRDSASWLDRGDDGVVFSLAEDSEPPKRSPEDGGEGEGEAGDGSRRRSEPVDPSSPEPDSGASRRRASASPPRRASSSRPSWILPAVAAGVVLVSAGAVAGVLLAGTERPRARPVAAAPEDVSAAPALPRDEHQIRAARATPSDSAVALIRPTGLAGRILAVMSAADAEVARGLEGIRTDHGLPARPPRVWLEGEYLASASDYPEVVQYWQGVQRFLIDLRDTVPEMVRNAYRGQLDESGFSPRTSGILLEEALIAFARDEGARSQLFGGVERVARAALDLHDFLVAREDSLAHDPFTASGLTRDPILEVAPASEELGRELWDRLDRVFEALDAVGALEDPDTAMLVDYLILGLQEQVNPGVEQTAGGDPGGADDQEGESPS